MISRKILYSIFTICGEAAVSLVKYVRIPLLPNRAGNNKIITPQEVNNSSPRERIVNFLWGDNSIITLPIG